MKATILDLRYKMKEVLRALRRKEKVHILYHGKEVGVIIPSKSTDKTKKIEDHPFFGMKKTKKLSVKEEMKQIRKGRYSDL